ncbi:MAG TPA: sodium:proton antiporter [Verrucomicrobiae bacterium]|nr:sodium:proton antiporter [Verrucomicrobiae bacterium]
MFRRSRILTSTSEERWRSERWATLKTPFIGFAILTRSHTKQQAPYSTIVEVAVIFAGIFATMIPALAILEACRGTTLLTAISVGTVFMGAK